eukprot:TRINITY_DN15894_c0_g1_i1.p2 TRINITY_DN15894_c0_g1~~TRINITY_DN15894_c0_g1_i1.p2  ORF type:complete len:146 (-),score=24.96 TRINITY_DN15894_c0_g1_i1:126-527(-)
MALAARGVGAAEPSEPHTGVSSLEQSHLQPAHVAEEIDAIVQKAIDEVLQNRPYHDGYADLWADQILDVSLKRISCLGKPFKYIGTCVLAKQPGSALDTAATAFWDTQCDSLCCTRKNNGRVECVVTIYACRR